MNSKNTLPFNTDSRSLIKTYLMMWIAGGLLVMHLENGNEVLEAVKKAIWL